MKRFQFCIILVLAGCSILHAQETAATKQKAREILTAHGEATGLMKNKSIGNLLSLTEAGISNETSNARGKELITETSFKVALDFEAPCRVRTKTESNIVSMYDGRRSENQSATEDVLNGESHFLNMEAYVDGKKMNMPLQYPTKEQAITSARKSAFPRLFPLVLDKFQCFPVEFDYVGIAESKDGRASIIEANSPDGVTYRMFFDDKTHFLLMMFETSILKDKRKRERRFFYSDYKQMGDLLVPSVVKIEKDGKLVETREIRALNLKPTFKAGMFNVKDK